ncbi:MAG TPA: hypothetical protein VNF06_02720, partial [Candidatus Aquilonibacter sp.]|nr:hypothetical protein [Candidatus Aquilonibacter sp.]
ELAKKYDSKAKTILELIQFDRQALELIEHSKGKYEMQKIIGAIEALKKYGSMDIGADKFGKLMELAKRGTPITEGVIRQVKKGGAVEVSNVRAEKIDAEIKSILKSRGELLKEFEKNPKSLNFLVGEVSKKLRANPREVAERLRLVLEKEYKS